MSRRRRQQRLERVLGTPALFSTAYGNVGSSIYYALGVTAVFALGLTPVVFVIAGVIFAEKVLPWGLRLSRVLAIAFVVLGVWIAFAPGSVPGLTDPNQDLGPSMGMTR